MLGDGLARGGPHLGRPARTRGLMGWQLSGAGRDACDLLLLLLHLHLLLLHMRLLPPWAFPAVCRGVQIVRCWRVGWWVVARVLV